MKRIILARIASGLMIGCAQSMVPPVQDYNEQQRQGMSHFVERGIKMYEKKALLDAIDAAKENAQRYFDAFKSLRKTCDLYEQLKSADPRSQIFFTLRKRKISQRISKSIWILQKQMKNGIAKCLS